MSMDCISSATERKHGDFVEMVSPHLHRLLCRACQILGSEDLAWDAVQETLLALWREPKLPRKLRGWLLRTVTHRSLHLRRTRGRWRKHEEGAAAQRRESARDDPAIALAGLELHRELERAIAELPEEFRTVFHLREVEGLDYQAIAALLCIPLGTVQSRLNRARSALRALLGPGFQVAHDCWVCGSQEQGVARCPQGQWSVHKLSQYLAANPSAAPATQIGKIQRNLRPLRNISPAGGTLPGGEVIESKTI